MTRLNNIGARSAALTLIGLASLHAHATFSIDLEPLATYHSGIFDEGGAEVVSYDPRTRRAFVVNANDAAVDVLSLSNPHNPELVATLSMSDIRSDLGAANSVAVARGIVAVAVENDDAQAPGIVAFYRSSSLELLSTVTVGALPDMVTFTPNGRYALVANEGEPDDDYVVDPEGSVSIIDLRRGAHRPTVRTASFAAFNDQADALIESGVRIFGPNASVAQDLEPEYITTDRRSRTAYVVLQENNAIAEIDIRHARVTRLRSLGTKDHSLPGNALDASNRDDGINIANWPVKGMYQPDAIASFSRYGRTYLVTANEGDARDYDGFSEEIRIADFADDFNTPLDPAVFEDGLDDNENLGRLRTTSTLGDSDGDGLVDELFAYGARSFSIWDAHSGEQVFDSGSEFEDITANLSPDTFNSTNDDNDSFDSRSDDKGPEPEGVVIGKYFGRTYAFIGLERVGGIMVYDVTNPHAPEFQTYVNNRNFAEDVCLERDEDGDCVTGAGNANPAAGDLGPEGLAFVPWYFSPTWRPLLLVGNEVSGTTTVYQIRFTLD